MTESLSTTLRRCASVAAEEVALVDLGGASLTYGQWDRRADALAAALRARTQPGDTVIARLHERCDLTGAVALFAAVRAGCFLLPMSGRFDDEDVARAAEVHGARLVLVDDEDGLHNARRIGLTGIRADDPADGTGRPEPHRASRPGGAIVYTAGRAATPTAVRWTHDDLLVRLAEPTAGPEHRPHLHGFPPDSGDALGRYVHTLRRYPGIRVPAGDPAALVTAVNRHRPVDVHLPADRAAELVDGAAEALDDEAADGVLDLRVTSGSASGEAVDRLRRAFRRATVTNVFAEAPPPTAPARPVIARAPLCWGQQWGWEQQQLDPRRRSPTLVFRRLIPLPVGADGEVVRRAVALSISRHSSLRTTFSADVEGTVRQEVWPDDARRWDFREFTEWSQCKAWLAEQFDVESGWPVRAAVLMPRHGPAHLGVAVHHIAADLHGFNTLCAELHASVTAYLAGVEPVLPEVGRHAVDIATDEGSPRGRKINAKSIAHWERRAEDLGRVYDFLGEGVAEAHDEMHVARTTSAAAARRLEGLSGGRGKAAVLVGAIAAALARFFDHPRVPIMLLSPNRHLPGVRNSVCSLAQGGLAVVEVADPRDLASAAAAAWPELIRAQAYAYYDVAALTARMRELDLGRSDLPVTAPSVNLMQADGLGEDGPDREAEEVFPAVLTTVRPAPCAGLNFHATVSDSELTIELRVGTHLVSAEQSRALVSTIMQSLLDG